MNKIAIGCDHTGFLLKKEIIAHLEQHNIQIFDKGTYSNVSTDYHVCACSVAKAILNGEVKFGILICGTGVGVSIVANKFKGIRAVLCSEPYTAKLSRLHNNSNVLAFGARVIGIELAKMIVDCWLCTSYEGGRHQHRLDVISDIEGYWALVKS